ncbi:hypothetical protein TWF281_006292 [Arthrobotrys megalospora]
MATAMTATMVEVEPVEPVASVAPTSLVENEIGVTMSYHDNDVQFNNKTSLTFIGGTFLIQDLRISPGQDPENKNVVGQKKKIDANGKLTFTVGRHGTDIVAKWWKDRISAQRSTFNHDPDDLNFAFLGKLTLVVNLDEGELETYVFPDIALAQGHSGSTNNWWFGGKSCEYIGDNKVTCIGKSAEHKLSMTFRRGGNSVYGIDITEAKIVG